MTGPYDDIIHLPHHVSAIRPQMARANRAAQFSPFAALTGYDAAIIEAGRLTEERIELEEDAKAALDLKLRVLADAIANHPDIAVTYFRPGKKKAHGAYVTAVGVLKKMDDVERVMVLVGGEKIAIEDVLHIECELFKALV